MLVALLPACLPACGPLQPTHHHPPLHHPSRKANAEADAEGKHPRRPPGTTVHDAYKMGKTLGTGGFSVVKIVTDRETGEQFACKIMSLPPAGKRAGDHESSREDIFKEIDILLALDHPNVVQLRGERALRGGGGGGGERGGGEEGGAGFADVRLGGTCARGATRRPTPSLSPAEYFESANKAYLIMEVRVRPRVLRGADSAAAPRVQVPQPPTPPPTHLPTPTTHPPPHTQILRGGELLEAVLNHTGGYSEADARVIFRQLLMALKYLHSK